MKKGKYKIEFHVHTSESKDSLLSNAFLFLMCKIKGIDCIAITDHNEIKNALKIKKIFEKRRIKVIVGEEIFTKDGEIIGLYLAKKILPGLSLKDTVKEIKRQNGLVYIPHPYDEKRHKSVIKFDYIKEIASDVDFIECHNGRNIKRKFTSKQEKIADLLNLRKIVGSDAHTFYEIGRNYCIVDSIEKKDLITEIQNAVFVKKECINFAHFNTKIVKIIKLIKGGKWNELSRIINKKLKRNK